MKLRRSAFALAASVALAGAIPGVPRALGEDGARSADRRAEVGEGLDRFLDRASVAADAAALVVEADRLRREARARVQEGRRDDAQALYRRAGETIAAAAPEGDDRADDPLLRQYLGELTAEIASLDAIDSPADVATAPTTALRGARLSRGRLSAGLARLAAYRPMMSRIFREEGVPEWLLAVGLVESGYSTSALSPKGALGIWQFVASTGDRYGLRRTDLVDERQDPEKSTRAAARYLRELHLLFGEWRLALAAYNAGEGRVARAMRRTGVGNFDELAARGLLPKETIDYVPTVLAAARVLSGPSSAP